jgi:dihydropteroate synthetase
MPGNKAKLKTSKSKIFIMLIAGFFITYGVVRSSGMYCNMEEFFSDRHGEEDDACIAKLVKQADAGDILAANRLRYPHEVYIKRVCEKGVKSLGERERYYFQDFRGDRCENFGFKTPKTKGGKADTTSGGGNLARGDTNATDGEGNLTRAEANNGKSDTANSDASSIKREGNSTEEQNAGR